MEIAVLDLGSTTFHLQHIRADGEAAFTTCLDEKRSICLGAQVFADGVLDDHSWLESARAVRELLDVSHRRRPDQVIVVATSAIRSASNGLDLVHEIERAHRLQVCVLHPQEEARLAYLGQSTSPVVGGRRLAAIDLGGGSVEVAVGEGVRCMHTASMPIGALRLRATHALTVGGAADAHSIAKLVREQAGSVLRQVRALEPEIVVFGSGSARAARRLLMRETVTPGKVGPIRVADFRQQLAALVDCTPAELLELGADPARVSTVLVAATIMVELLELLEVPEAWVSDKGLRDGVALEVYREQAFKLRALSPASAFA